MKNPIALAVALVAAGSAGAQTQDATPAQPAENKPAPPSLNIRLSEPIRAEPRIDFGPREDKAKQAPQPQQPADTLPSLGGTPSRAYERPMSPDAPNSPFPKDTNPNL